MTRFTSMTRLRGWLYALAVLAAGWALVVVATGGVTLAVGGLRLSSRNPANPVLVALAAAALATAVTPRGERWRTLAADWRWVLDFAQRRATLVAELVVISLSLVVAGIGVREGTFVAAGSDAFGYLSEARMWAAGASEIEMPLMRELEGTAPAEVFAPLAYRPSVRPAAIVPVVAPGLPWLMALFEIAGGAGAMYYVVPLLAGVAVWATGRIGRAVAGPAAAIGAAVLLATSPSFLYQITAPPMSDVPVTAWWALALSLLASGHGAAPLACGVAAGIAILIRPNLVPLAVIVAGYLVWVRTDRWRALARFAAGVAPGCFAIGLLNQYWYGGPLSSGYGALDALFRPEHLLPNLQRYPVWLVDSQTPVVALAIVAPFVAAARRLAAALLVFVAGVYACYAFYAPFDAWWFLRFLLPAFPALLALTAAALVQLASRLPARLRPVATTVAIAAVAWHGIDYAVTQNTFRTDGELRYATVGAYVADHLPRSAVVMAMQHSGSAWYYSGRPSIRYDLLPADRFDPLIAALQRRGRAVYLLVEEWEVDRIRERFPTAVATRALDELPMAVLPGPTRIYAVRGDALIDER
jgi:hypothetical protein